MAPRSKKGDLAAPMLIFSAGISPRQRAILHAIAEESGQQHSSQGEGSSRRISVGGPGLQVDLDPSGSSPPLDDDAICDLLLRHLGISNAIAHFQRGSSTPGSCPHVKTASGSAGSASKTASQPNLEGFIALNRELLEMERDAEVQQAMEFTQMRSPESAQARGTTLLSLRCEDIEGGLLGRSLLSLVSNKGYVGQGGGGKGCAPQAPLLPPHKFSPHDVVALRPSKGAADGPSLVQGVVYRVKDTAVVVAVDDVPEEGLDQPLRMDKLTNEVTYKRLRDTLGALGACAAGSGALPGGPIVGVVFSNREPRFVSELPPWRPFNASLDDSQRRAVGLALSAKDIALVHGPPGTGKTTAVVEIIRQEVSRGSRVLACAASNIAVDNLVERLAVVPLNPTPSSSSAAAAASSSSSSSHKGGLNVVRLGHPARLLPAVIECSLEAHVLRSDNSALAKDCRKEIKSLNLKMKKLEGWKKAERRQIRDELRQLGKEERKRQGAAIQEVIRGAQVIASTLTGVLHHSLEGAVFDVVVIDEAAQALEAACWGALLKGKRAVLAGDHLQLPPTIISDVAASKGLGRTLFERLQVMYGDSISAMLTVQYRMHTDIMQWSSDELYESKLTAHESVAAHTLAGLLPPVANRMSKGSAPEANAVASDLLPVLLLIDTAGCGFEERQEDEGDSRSNPGEAKAVMAHVDSLIKAGVPAQSIGIITPYNAQVALLKELRPERLSGQLEISSVDGFQGREKEAVVISMVRSNDRREVGFLADRRRMNVAVTRARRHCAVVCDSETVTASGDAFLGRLVKYFEEHGEYISAGQLVPE